MSIFWISLRFRLGVDHMMRNSLYLILSSGLQAVLGLAFWIIAARLFSAADIGRGSSLISAMAVIAYAALLGVNNTFVRYLPTSADRNVLLTAGVLVVALCGAGLASVYVVLAPVFAPRLSFLQHSPILAATFVLLTAGASVNLLTDAVFVATRQAGYNAFLDGGLGGVARIIFVLLAVGSGAFGVFSSSAGGFAAAACASLVVMVAKLNWRPKLRGLVKTIRPLVKVSGANYAGNLLVMLPVLFVPIIVLDRLGSSSAAYYFVGFQVASIIFAAVAAVEQTLLAEGSYAGADISALMKRSRKLLLALCLPACLGLIISAHWVLLAFGIKYSEHGTVSLTLLAVAVMPIAANNWLWTVLRLSGRLKTLILSTSLYAFGVCGSAWMLAPHGIDALTAAWPIGSLLGIAVALVPRSKALHRKSSVL